MMNDNNAVRKVLKVITKQKAILAVAAIIVVMSTSSPYFWTFKNWHDLLLQTSAYGVLLVGTTFVLISGACDLSLGGTFCLSGILVVILQQIMPLWLAVLIGILSGAVVGCVNGYLVVIQQTEPFIITLGMGLLLRGISKVITNARPIAGTNEAFKQFGAYKVGGVSIMIVLFLIMLIFGALVLARTQFGRNVYAVGGNYAVAECSGINAKRVKSICYIISGTVSAFGGILFAARMNSGSPNYGELIPLMVNCSAVIGGTSFGGGSGSPVKSVTGLFLLSLVEVSMNLVNISSYIQMLVKGLIIVGIVVLDCLPKKRKAKEVY
jgi:ribose transport system permease protein